MVIEHFKYLIVKRNAGQTGLVWHCAIVGRPYDWLVSFNLPIETCHWQVISNVTWNPELLSPSGLEAEGAVLLVGNVFSGCIHEGPQLEFHTAYVHTRNVVFGQCPLTTDDCMPDTFISYLPLFYSVLLDFIYLIALTIISLNVLVVWEMILCNSYF